MSMWEQQPGQPTHPGVPSQPAARPRMHPTTVIGLVVAILTGAATALLTGTLVVIIGVFALASSETEGALVAGVAAVAWLVGVAAFVTTVVLLFRGRGWARILLAVLSVASGALAIAAEAFPVPGVLGVIAVVLLYLPPSNRWFRARSRARAAPPATWGP